MVKKATSNKGYCVMQYSEKCKKKDGVNALTNFYMATSKMFGSKKLPICKDCMHDYIYEKDGLPNVERFKEILRLCDYPFFKAIWETSFNEQGETIGLYFKNVWLNFKDKTWVDSDSINTFTDVELGKKERVTVNVDEAKLVKFWGKGYTLEELKWLDENYYTWEVSNDLSKLPVQKLVKRICITELKIMRAEENGDSTDKLDKSYTELMEKASLTPKNLKEDNQNESQRAWGLFIKDIEKYKPAEYFEQQGLYEDQEGFFDYFKRFILRPLRNLLCNQREFDKEFNIEKEPRVGDVDYGVESGDDNE